MTQDQNDQNWLQDLKKKSGGTNEAERIGIAFRNRHAEKSAQSPLSTDELNRLKVRLLSESLIQGDTKTPRHRFDWLNNLLGGSWQWAAPLAALAIAGLWIWRPLVQDPFRGTAEQDAIKAYRGTDLTQLTPRFMDLRLAGHQFQVVPDTQTAELDWRAALIEAGVVFEINRSTSIAHAVEIHIRLSPSIHRLDPVFSLPKAPTEGEWIVFLIEQRP